MSTQAVGTHGLMLSSLGDRNNRSLGQVGLDELISEIRRCINPSNRSDNIEVSIRKIEALRGRAQLMLKVQDESLKVRQLKLQAALDMLNASIKMRSESESSSNREPSEIWVDGQVGPGTVTHKQQPGGFGNATVKSPAPRPVTPSKRGEAPRSAVFDDLTKFSFGQ
ncbi:MAG: hypothetical protein HW387_946 [Parachlamydiales bacterium]|nr:hypothetical protein [Parachlamydiales bacterium]